MAVAKPFKISVVFYRTGILISLKFTKLNIQKETHKRRSQQGQKTTGDNIKTDKYKRKTAYETIKNKKTANHKLIKMEYFSALVDFLFLFIRIQYFRVSYAWG